MKLIRKKYNLVYITEHKIQLVSFDIRWIWYTGSGYPQIVLCITVMNWHKPYLICVCFSQVIFLSLVIKEKYIYKVIHCNYRRNLLTEKNITRDTFILKGDLFEYI